MSTSYWLCNSGVTFAFILSALGASLGNATTGMTVCTSKTHGNDSGVRGLLAVILCGITCFYGLIIAIFLITRIEKTPATVVLGCSCLSGGLTVGSGALIAGGGMGLFAKKTLGAVTDQMFLPYILSLVFLELLGLLGLIIAILTVLS